MLVLFAIAAALAGVSFVAARRDWRLASLYMLVLSAPLEVYRSDVGSFNVSLFRLALIPAVAAAGSILWGEYRGRASGGHGTGEWLRRAAAIPLGYLLLALVVGLSLAVNLPASLLGTRELATVLVAVVAIASIAVLIRHAGLRRFAESIVASSVLPILASSWQAIAPRLHASPQLPLLSQLKVAYGLAVNHEAPVTMASLTVRTKGTFGDPNHYATFLLVVIACAIALTLLAQRERNSRQLVTFALCTAAATLSLVSSYSRSAWLGAVVAAIVFVVIGARSGQLGRLPSRRRMLAAGLLLVLISAPAIPNIAQRLEPNTRVNKGSDSVHIDTANAALHSFSGHPIMGIGPGWLGPSVKPREDPRTSVAHSTYLTIAAEEGAVGVVVLLLVAALTLISFVRATRSPDPASALLAVAFAAAYAGFLAANLTYDVWFDDVHWLSVGAAAALASSGVPVGLRRLRLRPRPARA